MSTTSCIEFFPNAEGMISAVVPFAINHGDCMFGIANVSTPFAVRAVLTFVGISASATN